MARRKPDPSPEKPAAKKTAGRKPAGKKSDAPSGKKSDAPLDDAKPRKTARKQPRKTRPKQSLKQPSPFPLSGISLARAFDGAAVYDAKVQGAVLTRGGATFNTKASSATPPPDTLAHTAYKKPRGRQNIADMFAVPDADPSDFPGMVQNPDGTWQMQGDDDAEDMMEQRALRDIAADNLLLTRAVIDTLQSIDRLDRHDLVCAVTADQNFRGILPTESVDAIVCTFLAAGAHHLSKPLDEISENIDDTAIAYSNALIGNTRGDFAGYDIDVQRLLLVRTAVEMCLTCEHAENEGELPSPAEMADICDRILEMSDVFGIDTSKPEANLLAMSVEDFNRTAEITGSTLRIAPLLRQGGNHAYRAIETPPHRQGHGKPPAGPQP